MLRDWLRRLVKGDDFEPEAIIVHPQISMSIPPDEAVIDEVKVLGLRPIAQLERERFRVPEEQAEESRDDGIRVVGNNVVEGGGAYGIHIADAHLENTIIGVAVDEPDEDGIVEVAVGGRITAPAGELQREYTSMNAPYHASIAYGGYRGSMMAMSMNMGNHMLGAFNRAHGAIPQTPRYQYTGSKFPKEVQERAWNLMKEPMTGAQFAAFMENQSVELVNQSGSHRLLINKGGHFSVLDGIAGEGFVAIAGRIREERYPLGDEIAAFIDWFRFKTSELISRWGCGTFTAK